MGARKQDRVENNKRMCVYNAAFCAAVHKALRCDEFQDEYVTMRQYRTLREVRRGGDKLDAHEEELGWYSCSNKTDHQHNNKCHTQ